MFSAKIDINYILADIYMPFTHIYSSCASIFPCACVWCIFQFVSYHNIIVSCHNATYINEAAFVLHILLYRPPLHFKIQRGITCLLCKQSKVDSSWSDYLFINHLIMSLPDISIIYCCLLYAFSFEPMDINANSNLVSAVCKWHTSSTAVFWLLHTLLLAEFLHICCILQGFYNICCTAYATTYMLQLHVLLIT